jgi:hypothetical protein
MALATVLSVIGRLQGELMARGELQAGDPPHARTGPRRIQARDRESPAGQFMIRSNTRVVDRDEEGNG